MVNVTFLWERLHGICNPRIQLFQCEWLLQPWGSVFLLETYSTVAVKFRIARATLKNKTLLGTVI